MDIQQGILQNIFSKSSRGYHNACVNCSSCKCLRKIKNHYLGTSVVMFIFINFANMEENKIHLNQSNILGYLMNAVEHYLQRKSVIWE